MGSSAPTDGEPRWFVWTDAEGREWSVGAESRALHLHGGGAPVVIPREQWDARIDYHEAAGHVVFRVDLADRQLGFLVRPEEALALLRCMQWTNARARASAQRIQTEHQRPRHWPTVTAWSMVALFAAALAAIPFVGVVFACVALLGMAISFRRARAEPRLVHNSALMLACTVILALALVAQFLSVVTVFMPQAGSRLVVSRVPGEISTSSKIIAVIVVLLSLSVHEAAHAVSAWWCGDEGPLQRGRVTLNPIAHIDPIGTILIPAVLAYSGGAVFGWAKPVMISLHGVPNPRRANLLISAAGPAANFLLGLVFGGLYLTLGCAIRLVDPAAQVINFSAPAADVYIQGCAGADALAAVCTCLKWGFSINWLLFFFNMIPLPPLDGGHVLATLFPRTVGGFFRRLGPFAFLIFLGLIYTRVISIILLPGMVAILLGFKLVAVTTGL